MGLLLCFSSMHHSAARTRVVMAGAIPPCIKGFRVAGLQASMIQRRCSSPWLANFVSCQESILGSSAPRSLPCHVASCCTCLLPAQPTAHHSFMQLRMAYQVLSDPSQRAHYDSQLNRVSVQGLVASWLEQGGGDSVPQEVYCKTICLRDRTC